MIGLLVVGDVPCAEAAKRELAIENDSLKVTFDGASASFTATAKGPNRTFVTSRRVTGKFAKAVIVGIDDKVFGKGRAIEVTSQSGNVERIMLYPKLPFVLFRSLLHNSGDKAAITRSIRPVSVTLDLGKPSKQLKALGTGGLHDIGKAPGSYVFAAVADPKTRSGVVAAWVTFDRGSGVVFVKDDNGSPRIEGQVDYGRLRIEPGKTARGEIFALGWFADARIGLERYADAVAKAYSIKLRPQPAGYCTWYHAGPSNETKLAQTTRIAKEKLAPYGFTVVQIDDGWQAGLKSNGPKKNFSTHDTRGPYKKGMKTTADNIKANGLTPGIWLMPFAGNDKDPFFKDHQDWFVKGADGKPYTTKWGGTSLDMTNPDARKYVRSMIDRAAHKWGYEYFKMDGMYTGAAVKQVYVNNGYKDDGIGDAVFHDPSKTNIEAYRDGLRLVRAAAGKDVFFLGCCVPQNMRSFGGAFGLVDAMRIGPDNGARWGSMLRGPYYGSQRYFINGRIWWNDPDPVYVRTSVPLVQARALASWVTVSGQLYVYSEDLSRLPEERIDIITRTIPGHGLLPRPVDIFETRIPQIWLVTDTRRTVRRDVIGLFNWSEKGPWKADYPMAGIGLDGKTSYVGFDFWANEFVAAFKGSLKRTLPKASCQVLAVRPAAGHPQLISTSRHITQGMIDVIEEKWDKARKILSGRSKIVAGDPYELRIIAAKLGGAWKAVSATAVGKGPRITAAVKQDGPHVRVAIDAPAGGEVSWKVTFKQ